MDENKDVSCQKLLFSATLTRDPSKISALHLNNPRYLVVQRSGENASKEEGVLSLVMEKFTMPESLSVCACPRDRTPNVADSCPRNI